MKALFSTLVLLLSVAMVSFAQGNETTTDGPQMTFESMSVDYGTIDQNSDPIRILKFTNTGNEPLIIKNAKSSCGCTVPQVPQDPINPGESSELKVNYKTSRVGKINKTIKITTNESGEPHVIRVKGEVLKPQDQQSAPMKKDGLGNG